MGVQTVEVSGIVGVVGQPQPQHQQHRPGSLMTTAAGAAATAGANLDAEKGADQWGKNMQRWRNDNIDIAKGS